MTEEGFLMDKKKFKPVDGSRLSQEQAERYGEHLLVLEEKYSGLTADIVVSEAKSTASPLHDFFEWDDSLAATEYRKDQARHMMRSIVVTVERGSGESVDVRVFHHVNDEDQGPIYVGLAAVLSDEAKKEQVVEKALRELEAWERKYQIYADLLPLMKVIRPYLEERRK